MIKKFFQNLLKKIYHNREFGVARNEKRFYNTIRDLFYSLQETYSYEEVKKFNELTTYSAIYGYCPTKGHIAIIGIPYQEKDWDSFIDVRAYGRMSSSEQLEFRKYSIEDAKKIMNYTVYGIKGIEELANNVRFDKIYAYYDSRYREVNSHEQRVLKMKVKLKGKYTFEKVKKLVHDQQCWAVDRGMAYATLENGEHVAIMSFWYKKKDEATGFRDVWESGKAEPQVQKITFMTDEEAAEIRDFSIYLYDYIRYYKPKREPQISKIDRTLVPGYDFYDTPDGKDFRLS